jgi:membrane fusion protein (multidrug efflux system)
MQNNYKARLVTAAGVLCAVLTLAGCGQPPAAAGPQKGGAPEVGVVVVQSQRIALTTELAGRTSASLVAEVRPQVGGIIRERLFTEGGDVKVGDVLYQIDPLSYQAAYTGAKALLARAEANLTAIRSRVERYKELVAVQAVSRQDYDDAVASRMQVEADIEVNKAAVETARINLAYTSVVAPISGRIGKSSVTTGALVTASQPAALATIQQLDPVYVDVTQSSANLLRLKQNMANGQIKHDGSSQAKVKLLLEDGTPYPQEGILKFSDVTVDPSTGSVTLRTVFPNPKLTLLPGMYVRAILAEGVKERAILVPQQGVTRDSNGNATALVVDGSDKVEPRVLKVERSVGDKWLVSEGLKPGDRVILEGLQRARPGSTVKVVPFGSNTGAQAPTAASPTAKK